MVSLPKNSWKNLTGLASAESGIFRPGWAVNGNTAGGTSVGVSTWFHFKALGDTVDVSVTRVIMYVCYLGCKLYYHYLGCKLYYHFHSSLYLGCFHG